VAGFIILVTPLITRNAFWIDNSVLFAIFSLLALSVGMSYGQAGILSLATGAFAAVGAFGSAIVSTHYGISPDLGPLPGDRPSMAALKCSFAL
jgi:branched-chain amino acid transport system permease protein